MKKPAPKGHTTKHAPAKKHGKPDPKKKHHKAKKHHPGKPAQGGGKTAHGKPAVVKHPAHAKHKKPVKWSPGWDVACCGAEAVAASLRLTGATVTDEDVLALYWRITDDPDAGASIWATLQAAVEYGLAGVRPVSFGLAGGAAARESNPESVPLSAAPGRPRRQSSVILGMQLAERHAVVLDGAGVWSWGEWWPLTRPLAADEAWEIRWL